MSPPLAIAHPLFGLGAPELIVILIILLVLFNGSRWAVEGPSVGHGGILVSLGVVFITCVGILLWHHYAR